MEKSWFTPPRLLWLVFNSGRVVRVSSCCITHVWHTRVNTSVGSVYILFSNFHDIKTYIYYVFKSIRTIKRNTGGLWTSKKVFDYPRVFKRKVISTDVNWFKYKQFFIFNLVLYFIKWLYVFSRLMIHNTSSSPTHTLYFYILLYLLFPH